MLKFDGVVSGSVDIAQTKALDLKNPELEPIHLLFGLLKNPVSISAKNIAPEILSQVENDIRALSTLKQDSYSPTDLKTSGQLLKWLTKSSAKATESGRSEISEVDLLETMGDVLKSFARKFDQLGLAQKAAAPEIPGFLTNLNQLAMDGKLDPVIGRETEIRSVLEILGRRRKNNPVLVGEAGVGKTAVVEGLAGLIVKGEVPDALKDKTVYSLDMGQLMAGTKFRGEFEERIQKLLKFIKDSNGEAILFIDEMHQLVGAGKTDGAMDAANLLKPALARGDLRCIGATTQDEFQKYILSDPALERRFRPVPILEPSAEDAIQILIGLKDKFEAHHGISISDRAIYDAVFWSQQYVTSKFLPDKAIDLIDEASAARKFAIEAMPAALIALEADIRSKLVLGKTEKADPSLQGEIKELQKKLADQKSVWEAKVSKLKQVGQLKIDLEKAKFELDRAQKTGLYEEASKIKYSRIPDLEKKIGDLDVSHELTRDDVADVLSRHTGIPVEKIMSSQQEKILGLEDFLSRRVFGQNHALHEISETLIASHAGLTAPNRPLGSFLLKGPSGVGKTETAKGLSEFFFGSEEQLIRLDLSEYSEKHSVAKLVGAPPGYVGYEEGGVLTEAIRRKPYAVILFDEVEKAHIDFSDILLQILDDGRLTDNKGRTISFRNTIVMMTSNSKDITRDFKPEVLGRLDGILEYKALDASIMTKLIDKQLSILNERLRGRGVEVRLSESLESQLKERGFDASYGARPLASLFNKLVIRPLSHKLLSGALAEGKWEATWVQGDEIALSLCN
jgi:ATP-dependent Clp protease ATP-binding subunit ClpB